MHTSPTASLGCRVNGGLNVYVREVCAALARRGVATDVFTRKVHGVPEVEALSPLSRVVYLPAGPDELDKYRLLDEVPEFAERVLRFIEGSDLRYDVLYSHYWLSGVAACGLRRRLHLPWAHTAHTLAVVKNRRLAPGDAPEPEIRADLEGEIARCAELMVVSTDAEAGVLRSTYGIRPDRLSVVAPGTDLEVFRPRPAAAARRQLGRDDQRLFVFAGRLERLKGVDVLLRAMALLTADGRHRDVRLLVFGEDSRSDGESEKGRLMAMTHALGLDDRVEFLGTTSQERLAIHYAAAEACVMPSYSESFGLAGLEAQACGTALVGSRVDGFASLVREGITGFLVDGPDPGAYCQKMRRLLEEPGLAERMGRASQRLARSYSWDATADRLLDHFESLAAAAPPSLAASLTEM